MPQLAARLSGARARRDGVCRRTGRRQRRHADARARVGGRSVVERRRVCRRARSRRARRDASGARRSRSNRCRAIPSIARDISIVVDHTLPAATVRGTIRSVAPETLVSVREFDRYQGKGVPDGRVSLSLRLTFRSPERTLTDAEVRGRDEKDSGRAEKRA